MKTHMRSGALAALLAVTTLSGCATATNPKDPFEGFNRAMFGFNDAVDKVAFKPAATIYSKVVPGFVQTGVGNFFGNLADVWTMVNNMLQGKMADGLSDMMRVAVNSTLGLGGVLDIGSEAGMAKHKEDFGQTLGKWGVKGGPYVVLPIFGSFTLRDSLAFPLDFKGDPWGYKTPVRWRNVGTVLRLVDKRAAVLDASSLIEEAALDKYEFVRDAFFLQRRANQIYDGESAPKDKSSLNHDSQDDDSAIPSRKRKRQKLPQRHRKPRRQLHVQLRLRRNLAADQASNPSPQPNRPMLPSRKMDRSKFPGGNGRYDNRRLCCRRHPLLPIKR
ncbi:VacJ family lipoprotein [Undibacterium arcticum]